MLVENAVIPWRAVALSVYLSVAVLLGNAPVFGMVQEAGSADQAVVPSTDDLKLVDSSGVARQEDATENEPAAPSDKANATRQVTKSAVLIGSLTVFLLAVFVGFEVITKVPPTLHTPLMSGSNAISGITVVGAILMAGHSLGGFASFMGMLAVILAMINVVGGFLVTHRMLMMFKKR